ncbi:flagellar assembly protein FliW [Bacillaceae bacterium S4-13-58]
MNIQTKYFGEIKINEEQMITFSQGLPGFHDQKEFVLLDLPDNPLFQILQSVTEEYVAFIVVNPYHFRKDYEFDLDDSLLDLLQIESEKDVAVFSILSLKDPFETSTMNLQAPVIINAHKKLGKQYITNNKDCSTKEFIFTPVKEG